MNRKFLLAAALLPILAACKPAATPGASVDAASPATMAAATPQAPATPAADASLPAASARDAVVAAMRKFIDVRSYHASMQMQTPRGMRTNEMDFVAPDRFRMQIEGMGTQYVIGDTMTMSMRGRSMQVPMPKGTLTQWRDPANLGKDEAAIRAEAQGTETVDGVSTHKYLVHGTGPAAEGTTLWIGDDGYPVQMVSHSPAGGVTVRYSRFNDPTITVEPPK